MRLSARVLRLGLVCLVLLVLGMTTTARAATASVTIAGFAFDPSTITVNVGDSITWTNKDAAPHSAKAVNGSFDTGTLSQNGSRTLTFGTAGTFEYVCGIHGASMSGTVVVVGAASPTPAPTPARTTQPTAAPTVAPTPARTAAPTSAPTAEPSATAVPGAGSYEDPSYGTPPDASPTPAATTAAATAVATSVVAAQPTASAAVASATASDGGPGPLVLGAGVLAVVAIAGAAWRLARR